MRRGDGGCKESNLLIEDVDFLGARRSNHMTISNLQSQGDRPLHPGHFGRLIYSVIVTDFAPLSAYAGSSAHTRSKACEKHLRNGGTHRRIGLPGIMGRIGDGLFLVRFDLNAEFNGLSVSFQPGVRGYRDVPIRPTVKMFDHPDFHQFLFVVA